MYIEERMLLLERRVAELEGRAASSQPPMDHPRARLAIIQGIVSDRMGIPLDVMRSRDRHADVAWARQTVQVLAFEFLRLSQVGIARLFNVDDGTIHHSRTVVATRYELNPDDARGMDMLRREVASALERKDHPV